MRKKDRDALYQTLQYHRRLLLKEVAVTETDLHALEGTRDSELEEAAQEEVTMRLLDRLDRRAKVEVEEIDRALARMAAGTYGFCIRCEEVIAPARLQALPATSYCIACANAAERGMLTAAIEEPVVGDTPPRATLPPEYALLSDRELQTTVREQLLADGRLDFDELRIVCRHGVVYVEGEVPSNAEHQILLHTLNDVMGLTAVVDHVRVEQAPWQREDRTREEPTPLPRARWQDQPATEDVTEAIEDGSDFDAPSKPLPDTE
ncbi:MAG: TraR/DksA C4-type zinc finger protein [Deltaproteobacteria bacterium]|nr:TraR/DksA C4-type zinc finger protein [Deltaproteobacteria bacterium]MBI3386670.1 TraR/DksA C4-type zinc finger protein [Deltaproteobacteria bacterium]